MPGEKCRICKIGEMAHPAPYIYTCDKCGYSYEIDPNAPWNESGIKIVSEGNHDKS